MTRRFRWAPTPSGPLHLGNLFSFLLTERDARAAGGDILLRIDDIDAERTRPEFIRGIFETLQAIGLRWELGPRDLEDFQKNFSQSRPEARRHHLAEFEKAKQQIPELFFACDCSRKNLPPGQLYLGTCRERKLPFQPGRAIRLRSELLEPEARDLGDATLFRKEGHFSYHWVSILDDLHWKITDIHRGADLEASTRFQLGLARKLAKAGLSEFEPFTQIRFLHHPLLLLDGKKLSKSEGAPAVRERLDDLTHLKVEFEAWVRTFRI